jgi:N-acetylglutamate synthase-like GNAT family acetyltransferase
MIIALSNPLLIPRLIEMAHAVPDAPKDVLERQLARAISRPDAVVYVDDFKGEIRGFIYASIENFDGEDVCFVQFCVVKPEIASYVCFELLGRVRVWANERGLKWIYTMTARNYKPFMKKYKFEFAYTVLKRRVVDERNVR